MFNQFALILTVVFCECSLAQDRVNARESVKQLIPPPQKSFAELLFVEKPELKLTLESNNSFLEMLRTTLPVVEIKGRRYYIAEGDILFEEAELPYYAERRRREAETRKLLKEASEQFGAAIPLAGKEEWLQGATEDGRLVRWDAGLVLTYRIDKATFSPGEYAIAKDSMDQACRDWEDTCGVDFDHKITLDDSDGSADSQVLFSVRKVDASGRFIAAAFFPNDPVYRRHVVIDPSFFSSNLRFDRTGVLRHELGHVLGFRHEHIRSGAPPECPGEGGAPLPLTDYDPQSVMHYFCGGVGSLQLSITDLDRMGSQLVYGQPHKRVRFFR